MPILQNRQLDDLGTTYMVRDLLEFNQSDTERLSACYCTCHELRFDWFKRVAESVKMRYGCVMSHINIHCFLGHWQRAVTLQSRY